MGWMRDDVTAILAITYGAAISAGLTGAFLTRGSDDPMRLRVEVPTLSVTHADMQVPLRIPEGYRAVTVKVDDVSAAAGWVRPGSHVDVLQTAHPTVEETEAVTRLLLQDLVVLGNDRSVSYGWDGERVASSMVTMLMTPTQAEMMSVAAAEGEFHLVLRKPEGGRVAIRRAR